ncbi:hypothetical protein [Streptomyces sp. NPDC058441]|uniref:hypothetical protein n=1 Tax=Streptomyces sp. NPDC058441 TaxID=3346502 RepID=UPI0036688568
MYDLFRRWQRDGTWHRNFTDLQVQADAKGLITWDINVESTVYRAHQHAAKGRISERSRLVERAAASRAKAGGPQCRAGSGTTLRFAGGSPARDGCDVA